MTLLEEDRKRQAAIRIQMEMEKQYGIKVTRPGPKTSGDVIPAAETVKTAAGGRAGRGGCPGQGKKSRGYPRRPAPLKLRDEEREEQKCCN